MSKMTNPVPVGELLAGVRCDPVAGLLDLIAEADSGRRRCDPAKAQPLPTVPAKNQPATTIRRVAA
jgi:hypothetical protein